VFDVSRARGLALFTVLGLAVAAPLSAQRADFLFGRPVATVSISTGWSMPGEGSDLFAETRQNVTIGRGDFSSVPLQLDAGLHVGRRFDLNLGFEYTDRAVQGEWRDWVALDDLPILQTTEFRRQRLAAGMRAYLFPRGRSISQYAWIPRRWNPYVAGGAGVTWYNFTQHGDFVTPTGIDQADIFRARVTSRGHGFTPWAAAGLDISLTPYFVLRTEVRQWWGTGTVDPAAFGDYNDIDLSGLSATIGFAFRTGGRGI
jgi:hypothetical protein